MAGKTEVVTLDIDTLDRITVCGLKSWRATISESDSKHPDDIRMNKLSLAAIDVILGFMGEK